MLSSRPANNSLGEPRQAGDVRPPGTKGYEALDALLQQVPEFRDVPGIVLFVDQDHVRVHVPTSLEGVRLLESPAFTHVLAATERCSGTLRHDSVELPSLHRNLEGSFEALEVRLSPDAGLQRELVFAQTDPANFLQSIRPVAPDEP